MVALRLATPFPTPVEARPDPALVALAGERSPWKRLVRFVWCAFLILIGQLAFVSYEPAVRTCVRTTALQYHNPFTLTALALLRLIRAPPQFA